MTILKSEEYWTDIQKEIWRNVEIYTNLIIKGDVDAFLEYFHEEYVGWNYLESLPVNKRDVKSELSSLAKPLIDSYELFPLAINVFKDFAIIHYYYSVKYKNKIGKPIVMKRRNTDILLYRKNKWILIGDHAGFSSNRDR